MSLATLLLLLLFFSEKTSLTFHVNHLKCQDLFYLKNK